MRRQAKTVALSAEPGSVSFSSYSHMQQTREQSAEDELRRRIIDGTFVDGRLPPERRLADELGIGRRALRTALDVLQREGRIWRRQGLGTFVGGPPDPVDIRPLRSTELTRLASPIMVMETRLIVEPAAARLAAMRATQGQIESLQHSVERTFAARSAQEYEERDSRFHQIIADIGGNVLLSEILNLLSSVRQEARWGQMRSASFSTERLKLLGSEHTAILDAIIDRDPGRAEGEMRRHLRGVAIRLIGIDPLPPLVLAEEPKPSS